MAYNFEWENILQDEYLHSADDMIKLIRKVGFLPLFRNEISGFAVDAYTIASDWWTGREYVDPWEWRVEATKCDDIMYGKFFSGKAGFITKEWFPYFANYRRGGYDFDALWDDEKANRRQKKAMDQFTGEKTELFSFEVKKGAGFGKDGEKNFDGTMIELQGMTYLYMKDFRQKKNKAGLPYGWPVTVFEKPENKWGYAFVTSEYNEEPKVSRERIVVQLKKFCPAATKEQIDHVI